MKKSVAFLARVFIITLVVVGIPKLSYGFLDLTTLGSSGFLDEGFFAQADEEATGTGNIHSFVRIQTNDPVEEGYNTSGRPLLFDENNSPIFTRDLLLDIVPIVTLPDEFGVLTEYRQFLLDINQSNCPRNNPDCPEKFLSLDEMAIYLGETGGLLESDPDDLGDLVFELTEDNIKLNYALNGGSGNGDMFAYIPDNLFDSDNEYLYLYSKFGEEFPNTANFEEWALLRGDGSTIPEPTSLILFGTGLAGAFVRKRFLS